MGDAMTAINRADSANVKVISMTCDAED